MQETQIRPEHPEDIDTIRALTTAAFEGTPHGSGTEAAIVDALRDAQALSISLVAAIGSEIVGHIAFSPVTIDGRRIGWFGLGPISVRPGLQRRGIGKALVRAGLEALRGLDAGGCILLGDPGYYARFGFVVDPALRYPKAPPEYFQRLAFGAEVPAGEVAYHPAFEAAAG